MEEVEPPPTAEDFDIREGFDTYIYEAEWSNRLIGMEDRDERDKVFHSIYNHLWGLLFGDNADEDSQKRAIHLICAIRPDAAFMNPFIYNDWIRTVKEEIIKRNMHDFWQQFIVHHRLGLIWAGDSDYFHDMDNPEPAEFYKLRPTDPPIEL